MVRGMYSVEKMALARPMDVGPLQHMLLHWNQFYQHQHQNHHQHKVSTQKKIRDYLGIFPNRRTPPTPHFGNPSFKMKIFG